MSEFPRPMNDLTSLNHGRGKFPYEVCLYHTESESEIPQVVAKVHSKDAALALARWYAANVAIDTVLVR